jgi:hypothetical protein
VSHSLTKALQRRRTLAAQVRSPLTLIARSALVAVALVAAFAHPAPAAAATPCWKALLNDWYDGRIDKTYAVHCYNDALKHLPADVQTYSSAHDDILRALQNAQARLRKAGTKVTANTPIPPSGGSGSGGSSGGGTKTTTGGTRTSTSPGPTTSSPGRDTGNGIGGVADKLNPSSPSSVPLPLIVLGALALLLVAAGAAGLVAKRRQGRRPSS